MRLGDRADLRYGDAAHLPFPDASVDLVTATLMLHELTGETRDAVLREVLRVLAQDGRLLVTDFHTGPLRFPTGWLWRALSVGAELLAWHLNRSWAFLNAGGGAGDGGAARAGRRAGLGGCKRQHRPLPAASALRLMPVRRSVTTGHGQERGCRRRPGAGRASGDAAASRCRWPRSGLPAGLTRSGRARLTLRLPTSAASAVIPEGMSR